MGVGDEDIAEMWGVSAVLKIVVGGRD